jgi:agmatine deiminase
MTKQSPASLGFRMPAEWEKHEATWLAWPSNLNTWGTHFEAVEDAMKNVIDILARHERVELLVASDGVEERAHKKLDPLGLTDAQLRLHKIEPGDSWIRDYGPIFIVRDQRGKREIAWIKWGYNAYGKGEADYADLMPGNEVPWKMPIQDLQHFDAGMILEGGSIEVNGSGTLITSESCLLSPTRNPTMNKGQIEKRLCDMLGVTNVLWLSEGIEGDDTTGHVDDLARFVNTSTVLTVVETDKSDVNYAILQENRRRLQSMRDEKGTPLTVIDLPMPRPFETDGRRMAASYANFYIGNGVVVAPTYDQPADAEMLTILRECFPEREVIGVDSREYIWGFGSIHCSSQQQPA